MENNLMKRKGKILLSRQIVESYNTKLFKLLFSNFFPIRIESSLDVNFYDYFIYYGVSPKFKMIKEGTVIPEYTATVSKGKIKFELKQLK